MVGRHWSAEKQKPIDMQDWIQMRNMDGRNNTNPFSTLARIWLHGPSKGCLCSWRDCCKADFPTKMCINTQPIDKVE